MTEFSKPAALSMQLQLLIHERQSTDMQRRRLEQLYKQLQYDLSVCTDPEQRLHLSQQLLKDHIARLNQAIARFSQLIEQQQQDLAAQLSSDSHDPL